MPFTPTTWADAPATTSPMSAANFNNMSIQYLEAVNSFEQDLFTPFVYGAGSFVATKDGTNASQLDVTAGVAFLLQSDSTLRRRAPTSSTQSTTGHPSTTLYLDLNPDGTWSWGTSHSGVSGHLTIASVTTDSSANIAVVSDARTLNTTLLPGMSGALFLPGVIVTNPATYAWHFGGVNPNAFEPILDIVPNGALTFVRWWLAYNGGDGHLQFQNTTGNVDAFDLDGNGNAGLAGTLTTGGGITSGGGINASGGVIQQNGVDVALTGSHSAGQPALSYGAGVPAALAANEIYFQVS